LVFITVVQAECSNPTMRQVSVLLLQEDNILLIKHDEAGRNKGFFTPLQTEMDVAEGELRSSALQLIKDATKQDYSDEDLAEAGRIHWIMDNIEEESCHQEIISFVFKAVLPGPVADTQLTSSNLKWFSINQLPNDQMWPDNQLWMTTAFNNLGYFVAMATFDKERQTVKDFDLKIKPIIKNPLDFINFHLFFQVTINF
jgi:hypothetical protein